MVNRFGGYDDDPYDDDVDSYEEPTMRRGRGKLGGGGRGRSMSRGRDIQSRPSSRGRSVARNNSLVRGRSRSKSRGRNPLTGRRSRSMSRTREERRDPVTGDHVNKFVTYKQFGMYAEEVSRVIAIDELPEIQSESEVIVKVKVSCTNCLVRVNVRC